MYTFTGSNNAIDQCIVDIILGFINRNWDHHQHVRQQTGEVVTNPLQRMLHKGDIIYMYMSIYSVEQKLLSRLLQFDAHSSNYPGSDESIWIAEGDRFEFDPTNNLIKILRKDDTVSILKVS